MKPVSTPIITISKREMSLHFLEVVSEKEALLYNLLSPDAITDIVHLNSLFSRIISPAKTGAYNADQNTTSITKLNT